LGDIVRADRCRIAVHLAVIAVDGDGTVCVADVQARRAAAAGCAQEMRPLTPGRLAG